ncbi:hypothetical protein DLAC_10243 [Tieghemostelium lacteum]|uniref:NADH dehydrogenase [ubiquinone] 1 alpha subcomplex assembly factor 3 n=1 Tax=Tieghemostelium lacteum TaxID=361077 RepID=A0A151Z4Y3_TIELA|nr:hypothetical protein DLAC_10243 [Tieghemostelium lacteum]|eukprot:KYQ89022.1 hypothetical protein DLAC_10243 [Tieghemostelium lacteum]
MIHRFVRNKTTLQCFYNSLIDCTIQRSLALKSTNWILNNSNNSSYGISGKRCYGKDFEHNNLFDSNKGALSEKINVDGYSNQGFSINKVLVPGSVTLMHNQMFLWDVHNARDITLDTLAILDIIDPPCEFIVFGTGEKMLTLDSQLLQDIKEKYKVSIEVLSTVNAMGTYNILVEEDRRVAAFLIPIKPLTSQEFREPHMVSKTEYEIKSSIDQISAKRGIVDKQRNNQHVLQPEKEEKPQPIVKQVDIKTPFQNTYQPTKNQMVQDDLSDTQQSTLGSTGEKQTFLAKSIIWFVSKFSTSKPFKSNEKSNNTSSNNGGKTK